MERSIDFKPSIKDEFLSMSEGDRYNIWSEDSYAMDVSICDIISISDGKRIIAFTQGGEWPILICIVTDNMVVSTYTPTSLTEEDIELDSKGKITEIQRAGKDLSMGYKSSNKIQEHKNYILSIV